MKVVPLKFVDPSGHFGICFQQGNADQADDAGANNTALRQMCIELAEQGYFGDSGSFEVFGNDTKGIQAAVAWLRERMGLHPDDPIFVMGYNWGGGGALDFVSLLNERGGDHLTIKDLWNDDKVPENVTIDGLILIDAVTTAREWQSGYADDHDSLSPNVKKAINIYATEDAYTGDLPFDKGLQDIEGALNVGVAGTNHCSIAYSSCTPRFPKADPINSFPEHHNGPINSQTLNRIKFWINPQNFLGR